MTNENFRRELGHVFDEMAGSPSAALPDRVRSSLADIPEQRGPFWIAGVAAAVIALVVSRCCSWAIPLNHKPTKNVPGAGCEPDPRAPKRRRRPTPACQRSSCNSCTGFVMKATTPAQPPVAAYVDMIHAGTHAGYDRLTIEFQNAKPGQR